MTTLAINLDPIITALEDTLDAIPMTSLPTVCCQRALTAVKRVSYISPGRTSQLHIDPTKETATFHSTATAITCRFAITGSVNLPGHREFLGREANHIDVDSSNALKSLNDCIKTFARVAEDYTPQILGVNTLWQQLTDLLSDYGIEYTTLLSDSLLRVDDTDMFAGGAHSAHSASTVSIVSALSPRLTPPARMRAISDAREEPTGPAADYEQPVAAYAEPAPTYEELMWPYYAQLTRFYSEPARLYAQPMPDYAQLTSRQSAIYEHPYCGMAEFLDGGETFGFPAANMDGDEDVYDFRHHPYASIDTPEPPNIPLHGYASISAHDSCSSFTRFYNQASQTDRRDSAHLYDRGTATAAEPDYDLASGPRAGRKS